MMVSNLTQGIRNRK